MTEPFRSQAIRLKKPWHDFTQGDILLAIYDDDDQHWSIPHNRGESYLSEKEIHKLAEFVGMETYHTYQQELIQSHKDAPTPPKLEVTPTLTQNTTPEESDSTDITFKSQAKTTIGQVRNKALAFSRQAEGFKELMNKNHKIIQQHAEAQKTQLEFRSREMQLQIKEMAKKMANMQDALHMVNLYLGTTEEVVIIQEGQKAPAKVPITIRQRILFKDEETMFLDFEGIDASRLADFDKFLIETDLLNTILPEQKGIVVMRVCRNERRYGQDIDPITQVRLSEENAQSYWIIRNGENLWRFWSDLTPNEKLFPSQGVEIAEVSTHHPKSDAYQRQYADSQGSRRTYLKTGLLLQGIIDRTNVFAPFPNKERPQLTDPSTWTGKLRLIEDDTNMLGEGKPSFHTWIQSVNQKLEEGQRVLVHKIEQEDIRPTYATGFNKEILHKVNKTKRGFTISFQRDDTVWDQYRQTYRPARKAGSIIIRERDVDWINFENAKPEDAKFYLRSRENREHYLSMIPMLIKLVKLKEQEAKKEEPFRKLLLLKFSEICQDYESNQTQLNQLVTWWKVKNKDHRPLIGDDNTNQAAYKAILNEFTKSQGVKPPKELKLPKETVLALFKDASTVHAYIPEEEIPWFCTKQTWKKAHNQWKLKLSEPHKNIIKANRHHAIFIQNKEWTEKNKHVNQDRIPLQILQEINFNQFLSETEGNPVAIALVTKEGAHHTQSVIICLTDENNSDLRSRSIIFKNNIPQKEFTYLGNHDNDLKELLEKGNPKAGDKVTNQWRTSKILALHTENLKTYQKTARKSKHQSYQNHKNAQYHRLCLSTLENCLTEIWKEEKKTEFLSEGGILEFLPDHLRTIHEPKFNTQPLEHALSILLDRAELKPKALADKSWPEIQEMTSKSPKDKVESRHNFFHHGFPWTTEDEETIYPKNFKLPSAKE